MRGGIVALLAATDLLLVACALDSKDGNSSCDGGVCASDGGDRGAGASGVAAQGGAAGASRQMGGGAGKAAQSGGSAGSGASTADSGGAASGTGGALSSTGGALSNTGGQQGGGGVQSGTGGTSAGGANGGSQNGGVQSGNGGASGNGGIASSGGAGGASQPPVMYQLVVDAPGAQSTVKGVVPVTGKALGFLNVEVWDATHTNPPLASATPKADGSFSTSVDTGGLPTGATTWSVHAWDSAAGQSFMHTDSVDVPLTIGSSSNPGSCSGQTCSGHGTCSTSGGPPSCACDQSYHAVGLTCVADSTGGDGTPDPGMAYVPSGYHLTFSDEFTGTTLDTGKWNTLAPFGVQFFSDSHQQQAFIPQGVSLKDGIVSFTAARSTGNTGGQPYSSGSITTNGTFTHGYFEARVKVPAGKGFWPAYWLTSSSRWPPEWDIFEIIDGVIYGYTHPVSGGKCSFVEGAAGGDSTYTISNVYGVFHVYGFKWTASDIYWYVDGVLTEHYAIDAAAGANDPFWLNLSLQVGGDWPGNPDSSTPLPAHMDVDYVRVYQ